MAVTDQEQLIEKQRVAVKAVAVVTVRKKRFMERMNEIMLLHFSDAFSSPSPTGRAGLLLQLVSTQLDPSKLLSSFMHFPSNFTFLFIYFFISKKKKKLHANLVQIF